MPIDCKETNLLLGGGRQIKPKGFRARKQVSPVWQGLDAQGSAGAKIQTNFRFQEISKRRFGRK